MSRSIRVAASVALAGAVLFVAGCGSSGTTESPSSSASPSSSPSPSSSQAGSSKPSDPRPVLQNAMLTPAEVGPGFVAGTYQPANAADPAPCGQKSVEAQFPNQIRVGTEVEQGQQLAMQETLSVFVDAATARQAFAAGVQGLSCSQSTSQPPLTIGAGQDVKAEVGGEQAMAWDLSSQGTKIVAIAVQSGQGVIVFSFLAAAGADTSTAPNVIAIAKKGVAKVQAV